MTTLQIQYQTSDLVPPPYAHSIELELRWEDNAPIQAHFHLTYLGREELSQEELEEEGFTGQDDIEQQVFLPEIWFPEVQRMAKSKESLPKTVLEEQEDYWEIRINDQAGFYPAQPAFWANFLQEIQQAILEVGGLEHPLHIELSRGEQGHFHLLASFARRALWHEHPDGATFPLPWNKLNALLREVYSGEFIYEEAVQALPKRTGLFLSLGDGWWFEVGKSYLNSPRRVLKIFGLTE